MSSTDPSRDLGGIDPDPNWYRVVDERNQASAHRVAAALRVEAALLDERSWLMECWTRFAARIERYYPPAPDASDQAAAAPGRAPQPVPQVRLDRRERDVIWALAADDLATLGDDLYHAGLRRHLSEQARANATVVPVISKLLDGIGWETRDRRDCYSVDVPPAEFAAVLMRWLSHLDGALADEAVGPDGERDREQVDADLDARAIVAAILDQVRPHLVPR